MDASDFERWEQRLRQEEAELRRSDDLGQEDQSTVQLDQQSVGRLSRMDALQRQALAQATARRRSARAQRIARALERLAEGEFGYCQDCGEEIATARLELDPAVALCLTCARG